MTCTSRGPTSCARCATADTPAGCPASTRGAASPTAAVSKSADSMPCCAHWRPRHDHRARPVAVIGAGPAGMATALSVHQADDDVPADLLLGARATQPVMGTSRIKPEDGWNRGQACFPSGDSLPCLRERRKAEAAMGIEPHPYGSCDPQERRAAAGAATTDKACHGRSFAARRDAAIIAVFTATGIRLAAGYLAGEAGKTSWEQVAAPDIQRWMTRLLRRYSGAYASIQFRALRQFFKWRTAEEDLPDPMARLRAPKVTVTAVPVFASGELSELEKACQGRSFAARRDAAIIAVFTATGIRLAELAAIRYHPGDPGRSDLDLQCREIRIRGKGGTARSVKIGHQAARSLDRYLRARARHIQAHRPQLWLGVSNRGPLTATGIYQLIARRGRECGVKVYPHRFR